MFCPLCRKIFCIKTPVSIHYNDNSLYSKLYVCKECSVNFGSMNAIWYILSCPKAKDSWKQIGYYVVDNIPELTLLRIAKLWGCTRWEYIESRNFIYNNMQPCYTFSTACDDVYNKHLNNPLYFHSYR